jgi:hypothetical protein
MKQTIEGRSNQERAHSHAVISMGWGEVCQYWCECSLMSGAWAVDALRHAYNNQVEGGQHTLGELVCD